MPPGIAPPTYQQAIQQESVPTRDQQAVPNEPPPEYTGPSPGYDASQTTSGHFHGESTMSTAEEQERTNAMEDGIGRLLVLSVQFDIFFFFYFFITRITKNVEGHIGPFVPLSCSALSNW